MGNMISNEMYDKISDDIYLLGKNAILRFNVSLSNSVDNMRNYFHREFEYNSKYANANSLITIRRSFNFFLSLENIKRDEETGNKEFIIIGVSEIMLFKYKIKESIKWFTDKKFENLYATKGDKLIMLGRVDPIRIDNLPMNKYIEFEPVVYTNGDYNAPGIRIYLSSENNFIDMTVDRFMGLYYIVDNLNMYESAQLMVNYLGRPDNGTNIFRYSDGNETEYIDNSGTIGRKIPVKNKGLG